MMLKIKTLQQRFVIYMLLPVALLLGGMGTIGFIYARQNLLRQWEESAILRLQRAAHQVDMRLAGPKLSVGIYLSLVRDHRHPERMLRQMLSDLERREGVVAVNIIAAGGETAEGSEGRLRNPDGRDAGTMAHGTASMHRQMMTGQRFQFSLPRFDPDSSNRTVSIITRADTPENATGFQVEVVMDFDFLLGGIGDDGWWQRRKAFLVDTTGNVLVGPAADGREQLGRSGDPLEQATLEAIKTSASGTLRGPGHPANEVSGFHRLVEAPWYMVVFAPGEEILHPIIRFRTYYFLMLAVLIVVILFLIRRVTGSVARSVNQLSVAAGDIARGRFDLALPERSGDEIGALTHSFNTMAAQLKDRLHLRQSLNLAMEVQQNLLPEKAPDFPGLDVAGRSVYCEETGGDYFDYLPGQRSLQVVIGDVAGHGIASALLMSSVRASLRQRYREADDLGAVISDVNRQIAMDVGDSGRFMTLLTLRIDVVGKTIQWVRAGHDPGMLYRRAHDRFEPLGGPGLALAIDPEWAYSVQNADGLRQGDIVLLGTDGIWETYNDESGMFGKDAVKQIVAERRDEPAAAILEAVFDAVAAHAYDIKSADDKTLIVVKIV